MNQELAVLIFQWQGFEFKFWRDQLFVDDKENTTRYEIIFTRNPDNPFRISILEKYKRY